MELLSKINYGVCDVIYSIDLFIWDMVDAGVTDIHQYTFDCYGLEVGDVVATGDCIINNGIIYYGLNNHLNIKSGLRFNGNEVYKLMSYGYDIELLYRRFKSKKLWNG